MTDTRDLPAERLFAAGVAQAEALARQGIVEMPRTTPALAVGSPEHKAAVQAIVAEQEELLRRLSADFDKLEAPPLRADLEAARKRIAELEETERKLRIRNDGLEERNADQFEQLSKGCVMCGIYERELKELQGREDHARANRLSDEAGSLRTERDELLRENATLRRTIERLERKGAKR